MPPPYVPVEAGALPVATALAPDDVIFLLSPTLGLRKAAASIVEATSGIEEAPNDDEQYVRKNEAWSIFAIPSHNHNAAYFTKEEINDHGVGVVEGTLTDALNILWDVQAAPSASVTLGANRTLSDPSNMASGRVYLIRVIQDGTGGHTLSYGPAFKWRDGTPPVITTTAEAVDILTFYCDGVNMYGVAQDNFA
jgi:hypothetical protein